MNAMPMASRYIEAGGLRLHYMEAGSGAPVLLLHGIPTNAHLWRKILPVLATRRRVIALDLPGFGRSDKPLDSSYSFRFYDRVLEDFAAKLGLERLALVGHDFGGPVGLYWILRHRERLRQLVLLNTLVYPEMSWAVIAFVLASKTPMLRDWLASPAGIAATMRFGVANRQALSADVLDGYQAPLAGLPARQAMLRACHGLSPKGFREIAAGLPSLAVPVRLIYGTADRILPDIGKTMARLQRDLPAAEVTALPACGHFLQEDAPDVVAMLLDEFLD